MTDDLPLAATHQDWTVWRAATFLERLGGLLVRPSLGQRQALLLVPCASVHTAFMRYAIDVVFMDRCGRVLRVDQPLKPWRVAWCRGAHLALELPAGQAQAVLAEFSGQDAWRVPIRRSRREP